jgi:hypothetical protein
MDKKPPSLPVTRKVWIAYGIFLVYTAMWYGAAFLFRFPPRDITFWMVAITMMAAYVYYVIQAFASIGGRHHLDLLVNLAQAGAAMILITAHLAGAIGPHASLWLAAALAAGHPLLTDFHHIRRYFRTEVADFVPPACILVDFSAAAFALGALAL